MKTDHFKYVKKMNIQLPRELRPEFLRVETSRLSRTLYYIYTSDIPISNQTLFATFTDDKAILVSNNDSDTAFHNLQLHLKTTIESWTNNWEIKINDEKSTKVNFSLKKKDSPHSSQIQ